MQSSSVYQDPQVQSLIHAALHEDLAYLGDVTSQCLVDTRARVSGRIIAKQSGIVCGMPLFALVLQHLRIPCQVEELCDDGQQIESGDMLLRFMAPAAGVVMAERTALNLIQALSGTASLTRELVDLVVGTRCGIYDTRKTLPGMRLLQKHAVCCGGGRNHRIGLFDQVLIKENHIALMPQDLAVAADAISGHGSPAAQAVHRCRQQLGAQALIEVEIQVLADLEPVIRAGADIVLLDNMPDELLRQAVLIRDQLGCAPHDSQSQRRSVALEASGGITRERLRAVAETGVERVSIGALTHSAPALDLSLLCELQ